MSSLLRSGVDWVLGLLQKDTAQPSAPAPTRVTGVAALAEQLATAQRALDGGCAQDVVDELEASLKALSVKSAATWAVLGEAFDRLDRHEERDHAFGRAVQLYDSADSQPVPAEATALAQVLAAMGRRDDAVAMLRGSAQRDPRHAPVARLLGEQLEALGDRAGAAEAFTDLARLIEPQERVGVLEHALELAPDDPDIRAEMGHALLLTDEPQAAVRELGKVADELGLDHAVHVWLAEALRLSGDPGAALARADLILDEDPDAVGALRVRATCHADAGRFDAALADVGRLLELDLGDLDAQRARVEFLLAAGRVADALAAARRLARAQPDDAATHMCVARILVTSGELADAVGALDRALALDPGDHQVRLERADVLRRLERYAEAREELDVLVLERPDDVRARGMRGQVLAAEERFVEALDDFERALEISGEDDQWIVFAKGLVELALHRDEEARASLDRVLHADPGNVEARVVKARVLNDMNDPAGAAELAAAVIAEAPEAGGAHHALALSMLARARWNEAIASFDAALEYSDGLVDEAAIHGDRARAYEGIGNWPAVCDALDAALALRPDEPAWLLPRARARYMLGQLDAAAADSERAADLAEHAEDDDLLTESLLVLGEVQRWNGDYDAALETLDRALAVDPTSSYGLGTKGRVLSALGQRSEAREAFRAALEHEPAPRWVRAALGDVLWAEGDHENALVELDIAIEQGDGSALAHGTRGQVLTALNRHEEGFADLRAAWELDHAPWIAAALASALPTSAEASDIDFTVSAVDHALATRPGERFLVLAKVDALRIGLRFEEALAVLDQFLATHEDDLEALAVKAHVLMDLGAPAEAREAAETVIEGDPANQFARSARVRALWEIEDLREALREIEIMRESDPLDDDTRLMRGYILFSLGRLEQAAAAATELLERDPANANANALLGISLRRFEPAREEQATTHLRVASTAEPDNLPWQTELADALAEFGDEEQKEEARRLRARAVERVRSGDLESAEAKRAAGWAALCLGELADAMAWMREALMMDLSTTDVRFGLGLAMFAAERGKLAVDEYETAAAICATHITPEYGAMMLTEALRDLRAWRDRLPVSLADDVATAEAAMVDALEHLHSATGGIDVPQAHHR